MNLPISERLKLMRESERITSRNEAAEIIGIPHNALWRYETGESIPKGDVMMKILNTPRFEKYALWFMTGKVAPESGQIAPALAHFGQDETTSQPSDQKIG
ncbi:helix-turn-helix domain-containing protein [Klebsiella pneumoniae]|uniref:helix-turn-helix domain-containing protein n=1 Tax=Klebsiella pneumoniae complex TaxID=3390273 RepID=UPI00244142EA|nr:MULTISPECIES: helix-turn-helix transcriptional regulator [Klebsiella]HBT4820180.1 helix-turn-helix transcriptional regulator [Klebsiella quasipneumoniae subsp. quasipneumoniae]EKU3970320.1 helix-turn-helix transcriptional regulator [Klebsiella pneumoniae]EKZ9532332.1 helix-turn-helix transcriptional regulator [Klebsiella pneumoniae]MDK1773752.1 helix-turn-helix domain-containing protein [Klebsiella pneumoniae]MEA4210840.1 helix-turn-helix transcriptional regulator [Klebsiella pneumoniae]